MKKLKIKVSEAVKGAKPIIHKSESVRRYRVEFVYSVAGFIDLKGKENKFVLIAYASSEEEIKEMAEKVSNALIIKAPITARIAGLNDIMCRVKSIKAL